MKLPPLIEYWYLAKNSQRGVKLRVSNVDRALAKLYKARKDSADPSLATLSIIRSPTDESEIWIVHRTTEDGSPEDTAGPAEGDDEFPPTQLSENG